LFNLNDPPALKKLFLFLLFAMTLQLGFSQKHTQLDVQFHPPNDTVPWIGGPYIVLFGCVMTSDTTEPFNGVINVRRRTPADTSLRVAHIPLTNFAMGDSTYFAWYDTIFALDSMPYRRGDNWAQLWIIPDSGAVYAVDTVTIQFYILDILNAASDPAVAQRLTLYPNPVTQLLHFDFREGVQKLESIQVSDLSGKVLQRSTTPVESLDFSTLPSGTYIVDVRYRDGLRGSYRVVRE